MDFRKATLVASDVRKDMLHDVWEVEYILYYPFGFVSGTPLTLTVQYKGINLNDIPQALDVQLEAHENTGS